ncbi:MAG: type I-E CRISPR-associated protein Cse2/CasB [Dermabacter sp.]|nr:type I-E CRISPR-associated protein Cse2/CasB [Dermabacter sp.]
MPTETPPASEDKPRDFPMLATSVGATAASLQSAYLGERSEAAQTKARSQLAELRRSAGFTPDQHPLALQTVLELLTPPLSDMELGRGEHASRSETAAFSALTLFAWHMQSATTPAHVPGQSFGSAMGTLRARTDSESLKPRFDALLASRHAASRLTHARTLISLLRNEKIGLDYGKFAGDLSTLSGSKRAGVLLRWSRDFSTSFRKGPSKPA